MRNSKKKQQNTAHVEYRVPRPKYTVLEDLGEFYPVTNQRMVRPEIRYRFVVLWVVLSLVGVSVLALGGMLLLSLWVTEEAFPVPPVGRFFLLWGILLLLWLIIMRKRILIFFIRLYQRYAPYSVRCMCIYIPNCSEYMVLAIKKYGAIRGVIKGFKRLGRCKPPYEGGEDQP